MAVRPVGGGGSGGGISIAEDMFFTSTAQRDTFTTNNPNRIRVGIMCAVTTGSVVAYYQRIANSWVSANTVVQGRKGDRGTDGINGTNGTNGTNGLDAPNMKFQYSIDGATLWHDAFNSAADKYWRWSADNGTTYQGPAKFVGVDGAAAPKLKLQYSIDGSTLWHDNYDQGKDNYWRWSVDNGVSYAGTSKIVGLDAPKLVIQYSEDGATNWLPDPILGLTNYWRWSTDGGTTWSPNYVRYTPPSGSTGTGFPSPFEATLDGLSQLQLKQGGELIYTQTAKKTKFVGKVEAGWEGFSVPGHTLGSAGENFVFVNNNDNAVYFPPWSSVSKTGSVVNQPSVRVHGATLDYLEVNGSINNGLPTDAEFTTQPTVNAVFFELSFAAGEAYTGRLYLEQRNSAGDLVLSEVEVPSKTYAFGDIITIPFPFPLWLKKDQAVQVKLYKEGDALMKVRTGQTVTTKPWRRAAYRTYSEQPILTTNNPTAIVSSLSGLTGADRLPASAIKDFPIASGTQLGMVKLGTGFSISGDGKLNNDSTAAKQVVVSSQAAMLALPMISNLYIANRTDVQTNWYLNADEDPAILANWTQGEYTGNIVSSFKNRHGAVAPQYGDYDSTLVPIADQDNAAIKYIIAVKNGQLGIIRTE